MKFLFGSQYDECSLELYLAFGMESGVLKILSLEENDSIFVSAMQCSYFKIHEILESPWPNTCILLLKDESILFVNFIKKQIVVQMSSMNLPLDDPLSIKLHSSNEYLMQASKYGVIRLWRIGEEAMEAITILTKKKVFCIRPCVSTSALSPYGLSWCDFIGEFFVLIAHNKKTKTKFLKIVAYSVTILNDVDENFEVLSKFEVTKKEHE